MTTYHYSGTVAWNRLGPFITTGRGLKTKSIIDPNTGLTPAGLTQNGVAVTQITADRITGQWSFTTTDVLGVVVDWGAGPNQLVASEAWNLLLSAVGTTDSAVAALVGNSASATRTSGDQVYPTQAKGGVVQPATISYTDIQSAATSAATFGFSVQAAGSITTSSTLTLKCSADLSNLTINYTGTGTAVVFGDAATSNTLRYTARLPKVVATAKTIGGWSQVAGSVGIDVVNAYSCDITVPRVTNFETGLQVRGATGNGTQQTTFRLGHLDNNKVNIRFTGNSTGWANQDYFFGGRCSHNSGEGSQVSGTRHVVFENLANPVNGHNFFGTSLESPDVVEYHIEAANSQWNSFYGARFENTGGDSHRRILNTGNSKNNQLVGGAYAANVTQTVTSPAYPFSINTPESTTKQGGTSTAPTMLLENTFSNTSPVLTIMPAGAAQGSFDPATAYCVKWTANVLAGKRTGDSFDRTQLDITNGRIYFGTGAAALDTYLSGGVTSMTLTGGGFFFGTDNTRDIGLITSARPRYVRAATAVVTGAAATGSRPAAATAGVGAMFYDTTLGKPIWSTGSGWVDATGASV